MRTLRVLLLTLIVSAPVLSEDWTNGAIGPFGGLNNADSSLVIPSNQAQDLLNVDVTPGGRSIKKREGYATAITLGITTSPVHGTHLFYDSSGNDVALAFNDRRITSSIAGATAAVIYSTATVHATWQCVDSQGYAYCANSSRDGIFKTEGVTVSPLSVTSTGTIVAVGPERLAQAGFLATPNRIDFSKANDFATWTVGSEPTDPITFTITAPGSGIKHVVYAHGRWYWFKNSSCGYILEGAELADWEVKAISSEIGTLDNTSAQDTNGNLYFRGQDGHIYMTDGANLKKISDDIVGTVATAGSRQANSLTLTDAADWTGGTITDPNNFSDTTTTAGNLQTVYPELFNSLRNGSGGTKNVWTAHRTGASFATLTVSGDLEIDAAGSSGAGLRTTNAIPMVPTGTKISWVMKEFGGSAASYVLYLNPSAVADGTSPASGSDYLKLDLQGNGANMTPGGGSLVVDGSTLLSVSGTCGLPRTITVTMYSSTLTVSGLCSGNGSYAHTFGAASAYVFLESKDLTGAVDINLDTFKVSPQTFTYTSAAETIPATISSWDTFTANKATSLGGSITLGLRSASGDAYTTTTSGSIPTISTKTYWQVTSTFTYTDQSLDDIGLSLSDITQNWFEGSAADKAYAAFHDDRVMFSVAAGDGATTNNRVLIYDLITPGWTLYDFAANGFYKRNGDLYFGSATGGHVYKVGDTDNDNGSAINAYWKSKDFFLDSPFINKDYVNLSVAADAVNNSSMTVTYTTDGLTSTSYTMPLQSTKVFARNNKNLPLGTAGATFNVQFGNNAADQPFEVFAIQYGWRPKSWVPGN